MIGHSPLGGSAVSRFLQCPGSVNLSAGIKDDEDDTFSAPGQAAHALGEYCLKMGHDAWFHVGSDLRHDHGTMIADKEMADAVQVCLDAVRLVHPDRNQGNSWVERPFHCPSIHRLFYGTADFVYHDSASRALHVWDYKHGAGIIVEVKMNGQMMYYACGALEDLMLWGLVDTVVLHIVQPRGFHSDGSVREWSISTDRLLAWMEEVLVPGMDRALTSSETASGEHCRFCPVRTRACPQILKDVEELEILMETIDKDGGADKLAPEQVARFLDLGEVFKIALKAAQKTGFMMLNKGTALPGWKLGKAKSNREWKEDAEMALIAKFGTDALTKPELKSPAQIETLPEGEAMAARYAHKPDKGLTLMRGDDSRPAVNRDTKAMFTDQSKRRKS